MKTNHVDPIRSSAIALVRLIFWGSLIVQINVNFTSPRSQLVLYSIWIGAFLWWNVFRPVRRMGGRRQEPSDGPSLSMARQLVPSVLLLSITFVVFRPWWGALFTTGCSHSDLFERIWPSQSLAPLAVLPIGLAATWFVLQSVTFPLVEEFTCRKWLLDAWSPRIGAKITVLLTALLFALLHLEFHPGLFVGLIIVGILLGSAAVVTRSIWPPVAIHVAFNISTDALQLPPFHGFVRDAYSTPLFRCGATAVMVGLFLLCDVALLINSKRILGKTARNVV